MSTDLRPMSALGRIVSDHGLGPANVGGDGNGDPLEVVVRSVEALEAFADAIGKPVVTEDGDRLVVAYEVEGVPALFVANVEKLEPIEARA